MVFYATLFPQFLHPQHNAVQQLMPIAFGFLAVIIAGISVLMRLRICAALNNLRLQPNDQSALLRWHYSAITNFVLCESIALLGFALWFLGGNLVQAIPFYTLGILLILLAWPGRP